MPGRRERTKVPDSHRAAPLARVLGQSDQVQEKVEDAADDLTEVNAALKQGIARGTPEHEVVGALKQSDNVEEKVQEAAEELEIVNDALADEVDARHAVEDELSETQAALTASVEKETRSRHDALHDSLTGLPNATLFKDRLKNAIAQARRHSWQIAVMFIDLDGFKEVNDVHGHDVGDAVLLMVTERLKSFVRGGDTVGRRSGDEFLFLMLEAKDAENASTMAQRITEVISAPTVINGTELSVQASIGLAMFPADGNTSAVLLKHADAAMYEAKRGRSDSPSFRQ